MKIRICSFYNIMFFCISDACYVLYFVLCTLMNFIFCQLRHFDLKNLGPYPIV